MKQLIQQIEQWAEDRDLIKGSTPQKQMLKLIEEFGELCLGITQGDSEKIKDSIGDCLVVLIIMRKQLGMGKLFNIIHHDNECTNAGVSPQIIQANIDLGFIAEALSKSKECVYIDDHLSGFENQLRIISNFYNLEIKEALSFAWEQIKYRKGKMINGVFIKEEDLLELKECKKISKKDVLIADNLRKSFIKHSSTFFNKECSVNAISIMIYGDEFECKNNLNIPTIIEVEDGRNEYGIPKVRFFMKNNENNTWEEVDIGYYDEDYIDNLLFKFRFQGDDELSAFYSLN